MICPPFFWQEFAAYKGTGTPDDIFGGQNGLQNEIQTLVQKYTASVTGASQTPEMQDSKLDEVNTTIENDISQAFKTLAQAGTGALAVSLTPEDKWAIDSYQNFISDGIVPSQVSKLNAYSGTTSSKVNLSLQKNAWILSDVYLEKGLITFEEQQVWATIYEAASRSNREVYFDIAPKLTKGNRLVGGPCKSMFDTAEVPEIGVNNLGNTKYNPNNLDDIHPNIGILKYRLSPCFLPYPSGGVDPAAEFRYFDITDDMIMETETSENEQMVFSAVYGFADSFNNQTIPDYATSVLSAASPFPFVYAHSIDPNIEKRLGYRFMTEHDNKIKILPLMYLVSYILLEKSQLSMFSQTVKITGNPIIQPGSIVKMESQQVDYYCTEVQHNWGFDGYTTSLVLQYGHQTGVAPAAMTGVGVDEQFTQLSTMLCQSGANQVAQFVPSSTNIGGVNEQCLISAMWEYMTCRASTSDALKKCTRAYETANPYKGPAEWASLSYNDSVNETWSTNPSFPYPANIAPQPSTNRDSQIDAALTQTGAAAYNFTRNILKNIINYESSWVGNNYNPKGPAYGWFQLTPGSGADNSTDQQTVSSYNGFGVAATKACNLLIQKCTALGISQNNASGPNVMAAVNAYGDGTSTYASNVMGDSQYNQIMSNPPTIGPANSTPGNIRTGLSCQDGTAAANLTKWPYDVYGPIGMHPSSVAQVSSGTSISQAKQLLLGASPNTFADAMTVSVKYMDYLLRKYSNATFMQNQPGYSFLTQSDTFSKVIAAWFSDETVASSSALAILPNVITQINSLYQQCIGCTGVNQASISANSSSENMAVFQGINWQCPLGSGAVITGQFHEPRVGHLHQGIDIVQPNSSNVGTAVVAPADGIVSPYTEGGAGGLAMSINHTLNGQICGAQSVFYDIGKYAPGISAGSTVKAGQIVAYLPTTEKQGSYGGIGANGQALIRAESGFHLHWEVRPGVANASTEIGGQAVDPNQFLNPTLNLA
jgi:murein DD-endopeptidase MepM/ murein hydrolase activator NlpD